MYNDGPVESRIWCIGAIFNDLERLLTWLSRSRHCLTLNMSQTATDMATVTGVGRGGKGWGGEGRGEESKGRRKQRKGLLLRKGRAGQGGEGRGEETLGPAPLHIISGYATVQLTDINSRT